MAGRFPPLTDENVPGPIVKGLRQRGWDVVRAVDALGEQTYDPSLFEHAVREARVMATTDDDYLVLAHEWLAQGRSLRLIFWAQGQRQRQPVGTFLDAFEGLAGQEEPFASSICYLRLPS